MSLANAVHFSLDIESLGTTVGSAIVSIGCVEFDPFSERLGETFYSGINVESCLRNGLTMDAQTVFWWLQQSDEARKALADTQVKDKLLLSDVLINFSTYLRNALFKSAKVGQRIWAKGPSFDVSIIEHACKESGVPIPWKYNEPRCVRTIVESAMDPEVKFQGIEHNALDDAVYQARCVQEAYRSLGIIYG
jgi:exodeoxyribonuclease VIII